MIKMENSENTNGGSWKGSSAMESYVEIHTWKHLRKY